MVDCFGFNGPLRQYFSLYRAVSQREGERGERIDESKNVQTTPTRTNCKCNRPLPYCYQNCRTPRHWKCRGVLLIWIIVGQGPIALAVGAGGGCLDIFSLIYHFSFLSPSFWETARYRLKYCLKGPLSPKQPTNQPTEERAKTKCDKKNWGKGGGGNPTTLTVSSLVSEF